MSARLRQKAVRKTGWLSKRGGRIHTWHKRWFVLTGDLLFYYKNPQDSRPTGTIPLAGNKVVRHADDPKQQNPFKLEIMAGSDRQVITSNHNTYLISAESAEEADNWVAAIRRVMCEPFGGGMFGRGLEETLQVEGRLGGTYIPILIHRCVRYLRDSGGLKEVGIFRLPGKASRVHQLRELYDQGHQQDFRHGEDIHTVASLLKLYLRELPEPIVPYAYYESFKKMTKLHETNQVQAVDQLKRLMIQIPKANFNVLKYMSRFLHEVQSHSEENKMTPMNLGTIFGPHLLRPKTDSPQVLMDSNTMSGKFVCILIQQCREFFPPTEDERPPKRLSLVAFPEEPPLVWHENKLTFHSLYDSKTAGKANGRPRQNSVPAHAAVETKSKGFGGKVASMVEQFNMRSTRSSSTVTSSSAPSQLTKHVISLPILQTSMSSTLPRSVTKQLEADASPRLTREASLPVDIGPRSPQVVENGADEEEEEEMFPPTQSRVPPPSLNGRGEGDSDEEDDEEVPEMLKRFSGDIRYSFKRTTSDTLSSDVIVNTISKELEMYERQLAIANEEVQRYKKAARLWKSRYEQERRARLAAEEQVHDLQELIDETFKQFALDDSEDDSFCDEDSSDAGGSGLPTSAELMGLRQLPAASGGVGSGEIDVTGTLSSVHSAV